MMTAAELARRHLGIARNYKTVYGYAMYGWAITDTNITAKAKQNLNNWYSKNGGANEKKLRALVGQGYWGFDCVNLTKAVLWGWNGDDSSRYGGAVYGSNGVPDTNANGMIQRCYDVSTDFSSIQIGEGLWMDGHWGLYVGDGLAVECTNWSYCDGVQITAVLNIGKQAGYRGRRWTKHGKLPYVTYDGVLREGARGDDVKAVQTALLALGYYLGQWGADGDYGAATANAVMAFQDKNGLFVTGEVDATTRALLEKLSTGVVDNSTAPVNPAQRYRVTLSGLTLEEANGIKATWPDAIVGRM